MKKIVVNKNENGKKLSSILNSRFPNLKNNTFNKFLRKKDIRINSNKINSNNIVFENDIIEIFIPDELLYGYSKIFEDDNILIINKPIKLEVTGTNSLSEILDSKYDFIKPCNRIDANTFGLVLFAKNNKTLNLMKQAFINQNIEKHYFCISTGIFPKKTELHDFLLKDSKNAIVKISKTQEDNYVPIHTSIKLVKKINNLNLIDVTLHTGKTHQIRAHLAFYKIPILGDNKYGNFKINKEYNINIQQLCSYSLKFNFPKDSFLEYLNNFFFSLSDIPFTSFLEV